MTETSIYALVFLSFLVGGVAIFLTFRDEKHRTQLEKQKREIIRKYYEVLVLQDISSKIGYSFGVGSIAETIVLSVENLFNLSTISYATIEDEFINIKTFQKEPVAEKYAAAVKNILLASVYEINPLTTGFKVHETSEKQLVSKNYISMHQDMLPKSYFTIPLVVNNIFVGVITITSRAARAYSEEDMNLLFGVVNQAEMAFERLQGVIENEKQKLAALISGIPSGAMLFVVQDERIQLETINSSAKKFLGFKGEDEVEAFRVIGRFGVSVQLDKQILEAVREQKSIIVKDMKIDTKHFKVFINPIPFNPEKGINGVTVSLEDKTMEKELEEIRESFTNMVVHELRSPMTSIKGAAGLLMGGKLADEDQTKMLHIVKDSSERMLTQINDLLDAAKLQAGKFQIMSENSNINDIVEMRVDAFKFLAEAKKITVEAKTDTSIPEFKFDKVRIDQVITNLVSNSLKFTPEGGKITVSARNLDDRVEVAVEDTGIGIPEEKQSMLFSKYTQVQNVFSKDGTGLGLFISRGIIDSHGGKIWIESEVGKGTKILFTLPMVIAKEDVSASDSLSTPVPQPVVN